MAEFKPFEHFGTDAIHVGQEPEKWKSMAVVPPISMATTFKQFGPGEHAGYEYSRSGNPTRACLEECLAKLENAKYGLTFASGLAATNTITFLLKNGDHILAMDDLYGGTNRMFRRCTSQMGIELTMVDCTDLEKVESSIRPNTKMVWIETPTNPMMKLVDIASVVKVVRAKASKECFVVVDNTFMSSYFQRPLDHGADLVFHSMTKYMNGHSDVVMGCICTNREDLNERLFFLQYAIGAVPSPFDCFLANRGLKTLHIRMREHMKNGLAVAKFLEENPRVEKVIHPGLPSHPQHEPCATDERLQWYGFILHQGGKEQSSTFLKTLKIFTLAESLGGFESLAELPSVMTHASVPPDQRDKLGISDSLIRLSVGIEDVQDLIEDLDLALKAAIPEE